MERSHDVTAILEALSSGEDEAADELFAVVYDELRTIARSFMARERPDHTLQPTAVVHEAYVRLLGSSAPRWENRAHFFGTAARSWLRRELARGGAGREVPRENFDE